MNTLVNEFLKPNITPQEYILQPNVIEYKKLENGNIYIEIYKTNNNLLSFHYHAWIVWRDANNEIRSHSWHILEPTITLLTDNINDAKLNAEKNIEL